ncbi:unnamed protein product [Peronospora effusa]|uniref:Sulfatase N-terminal domain-containing protein n=1 Tax=Peronospora effusa TaxID=542832 RepID=A0A3M6VAZ7_9STRA|nr:hypothetical protein DD238_006403 [Peronospora effusa]RQM15978.1 hypothetical protein DD237_006886 [Peronospora effusa]CAI5723120.1 unnamed protein product [Peronospora effusa]
MVESHRLSEMSTEDEDQLSVQHLLPEPLDINDGEIEVPILQTAQPRTESTKTFWIADVVTRPWFGWLFVFVFLLFCFSVSRCIALKALATMYGSLQDYTVSFKFAALSLGFMEDFVCTTYVACILWLCDTLKLEVVKRWSPQNHEQLVRVISNIATFTVSWVLFVVVIAPFAFDLLLVINRNMRFSIDLLATLIREKQHLKDAPISIEEFQRAYTMVALLVTAATVFALVRACASWADLACWNPTHLVAILVKNRGQNETGKVFERAKYVELALEEEQDVAEAENSPVRRYGEPIVNHAIRIAVFFVVLVVIPAIVVIVRYAFSPVVAYVALNATLNELFGHALQPSATDATYTNVNSNLSWMKTYIHPTERYKLFGNDSLYRLTTGFRGDLAFDVNVSNDNPPNVIVIGVESFRFRDSHYMVGKDDPSNLYRGTNLTITPNFDRWAKRGVGLRNLWTSIPTSRSVESILFAQVPYDSATKTGLSGGRNGTKLAGLPQLFSAKGYETFFYTGCSITLDQWDIFFPTHGFDTVWDVNQVKKLAENNLKIPHTDWSGKEKRAYHWGVHDDLNFKILGDLLVNKTIMQKQRVANGEPKMPLFLTQYTATSHSPFVAVPTWYANSKKPDFSVLYDGEKKAKEIRQYYEARYFTDMELGKFLDRMKDEGILEDTIVVIMGDHGTTPEIDIIYNEEESVTRVAGAIIAEGRLGKAAGLLIEDAVEHYDMLNTLADITGVPEGGFIQNGIGRSLKRNVSFGERAVYSNMPGRRLSVVRGNQRLRYDNVMNTMLLHNIETDYSMLDDLFPKLSLKEQTEWEIWRKNGRYITEYYKKRWDGNCLLATNCTLEPPSE